MRVSLAAACVVLAHASVAVGQSMTASGGVATGFVDDRPGSAVEAGVDIATGQIAAGLGGRLVLGADGTLRRQDWDEPSEWATVLRYFNYRRAAFEDEVQASVAAGELSGVTVGFAALIDDYQSGIDINHRHLGVHGRVSARNVGASLVVDDVVAPRIGAARASYRIMDRLYGSLAIAADLSAPSNSGESEIVGGSAALNVVTQRSAQSRWLEAYVAAAGWARLGAGAHLGGRASMGQGDWRLKADAQVILASAAYIPGYIGSLYEFQRSPYGAATSQLDLARAGQLGGIGGRALLSAERIGLGTSELRVGHKPGLGPHVAGRLLAAERRRLQLGLAGSYQKLASSRAWVAAAEARLRLPSRLFTSAQISRMYRRDTMSMAPAWSAWVTLGGVVGE